MSPRCHRLFQRRRQLFGTCMKNYLSRELIIKPVYVADGTCINRCIFPSVSQQAILKFRWIARWDAVLHSHICPIHQPTALTASLYTRQRTFSAAGTETELFPSFPRAGKTKSLSSEKSHTFLYRTSPLTRPYIAIYSFQISQHRSINSTPTSTQHNPSTTSDSLSQRRLPAPAMNNRSEMVGPFSMPAKKQASRGRNQPHNKFTEEKKDETIAFVLCHPLECSLEPITCELPPCLFPVCNSPALLYTLNWLHVNGIEMIYVLCAKKHANAITKVVQQCRERMLMESIEVLPTDDEICTTGHAMRWIDAWRSESSSFRKACVVVQGNTITNVPLASIVADHRKRVESAGPRDLVPVMTTVFTRSSGPGYSVVLNENDVVLDVQAPPVIPIEDVDQPPLVIKPAWQKWAKSLRVKTGLQDSKIYICTSQLFADFKEEWDWKNVMTDCIPTQFNNMLLTKHATYAVINGDCYAAVTDDLPDYLSASLAIVRRWLYPVTVEMNFFGPFETQSLAFDEDQPSSPEAQRKRTEECTAYRLGRDLVYLHDKVFPELTSRIGHSVVVGNETVLSAGCKVMNTTIGNRCVIGEGAVLNNCVIWDGVKIGNGANLSHCVVASGVTVGDNVTVGFGSILSFSVCLSCNLPPCRRLTQYFGEEDDDVPLDDSPEWLKEYVNNKPEIELPMDDQSYEYVPALSKQELPLLRMWYELSPEDFPVDVKEIVTKAAVSNDGLEEEEEAVTDDQDDDFVQLDLDFQEDASELLKSLCENHIDMEQFESEFFSLKNSKNASHVDCAAAIWLQIAEHYGSGNLEQGLDFLGDLLKSFLDPTISDRSLRIEEIQVDFLFWWQCWCAKMLEKRKAMFAEGVEVLLARSILKESSVAEWSDQQDDCNDQQREVFESYKED